MYLQEIFMWWFALVDGFPVQRAMTQPVCNELRHQSPLRAQHKRFFSCPLQNNMKFKVWRQRELALTALSGCVNILNVVFCILGAGDMFKVKSPEQVFDILETLLWDHANKVRL